MVEQCVEDEWKTKNEQECNKQSTQSDYEVSMDTSPSKDDSFHLYIQQYTNDKLHT